MRGGKECRPLVERGNAEARPGWLAGEACIYLATPMLHLRDGIVRTWGSAMAGTGSPAIPGEKYVLGIMLIAAAGTFVTGIVVGIVAVVSHGIHREEKRFRQERRFRKKHGIWAGADAPEYFLAGQAPDGVTFAARRLNGLHVRRLPSSSRHDADPGAAIPASHAQ
jgi:hypothetical protein